MTRLEKEGLIKTASKGKRLGKLINKDMIENAMKKYFDRNNNNSACDKNDTMPLEPVSVCMCMGCVICYVQGTVEEITQHTSRIDLQCQQQQPVKRVRSIVDEVSMI